MTDKSTSGTNRVSSKQPYWMLYIAGLFGGIILLTDALGFVLLERVTTRLAIALIYSTFVLMVGKGKKLSIAAAVLIWAAVIATFIW